MAKKLTHLIKKLKNKETVILDGATGTEIQNRGVKTTLPLWSASCLFTHPDLVKQIHIDYIQAGADIITTNTFRTTKRTLKKANMAKEARKITLLACKLAHQAIKESKTKKDIYIAGSIAPLEDCYSPDLTPSEDEMFKEHSEHALNLKSGRVDFLLIETMITIKETLSAIKAAIKTGLPFAVSFCCNKDGNLLGGEPLTKAIQAVKKYNPLFVGINCMSPEIISKLLKTFSGTPIPVGVYANGEGKADDDQGWLFTKNMNENKYLKYSQEWVSTGVQVIGGCCGTSPAYIKNLSYKFSKYSNHG